MHKALSKNQCVECYSRFLAAPTVLVVLHHDGYVEAFGERETRVKIVNLLYPGPTDDSAMEVLCEEYLDATLPKQWRDLHVPNKRRAIGLCERRTGQQELTRLTDVEELRLLREAYPTPITPPCRQEQHKTLS